MDTERKQQHNRLTEPERSNAAKKGWRKHHSSYMRGVRKKSRKNMNQSFYGVADKLKECINSITEAKQRKDNVFDYEYIIDFDNISGGISFEINKETGEVSFSVSLNESGRGNFKLENFDGNEDTLKNLYEDIKEEIKTAVTTMDEALKQISATHGLKET